MIKNYLAAAALLFGMSACGSSTSSKEAGEAADSTDTTNSQETMATNYNPADTSSVKVEVETTLGSFTVLLYGDTPRHRDNFIKLVKEGYYNNTLFHRVINEFMIQAGDPDSKTAVAGQALGSGGPGYTVDAEFVFPKHFHKRGALAAARQGDQVNPTKASSGSQFYIVTGKKVSEAEMANMEQYMEQSAMQSHFAQLAQQHMAEVRDMQAKGDQAGLEKLQNELIAECEAYVAEHPVKVTDEMKKAYTTVGGTPHLDNNYTVFGEVVNGMETVDKIEKVETDRGDRPKEDIRIISMKVVD